MPNVYPCGKSHLCVHAVSLQSPPETCSGLVIKQQSVACECSVSNAHVVPAGLVPTGKFSGSSVCMFYFCETRSHLAQVGLKLTMQPGQQLTCTSQVLGLQACTITVPSQHRHFSVEITLYQGSPSSARSSLTRWCLAWDPEMSKSCLPSDASCSSAI